MKTFTSFAEQIDFLKTKALIIDNQAEAEERLRRIGYFGLIGGYKDVFKNQLGGSYHQGTRFEDIIALYDFDENLRELFLKYILRVERSIRSLLSYYFAEKHGADQREYLDKANFSNLPKHSGLVAELLDKLNRFARSNSEYAYVNHHRTKHGNVPLWVLINVLTFGTLSKFFLLSEPDVKTKVAKNFTGVNWHQLGQFLNAMTKYRNACSHSERFFTFKVRRDIPDMPLHARLKLSQKGTQYLYGKRDLFALVISFRYLLTDEDFREFKHNLVRIINRYLKSTTAIGETDLNAMLGFPPNWKSIARYNK
jgi:abortive infection bacteriophage resistance protein